MTMQPVTVGASRQGTAAAAEVRTFVIADIRGYTQYTVEHGDAAGAELAQRFADIARDVVSGNGGEVVEVRGDEVLAVFTSTRQALVVGVELQRVCAAESTTAKPIRVGVGVDAGEAIAVAGGYRGAALNLAARLCSLAGPGEVLASDTAVHLARRVEGLTYSERGFAQLKGFSEPVRVIEVRGELAETVPMAAVREQKLPIGGFLGSLPSGLLVGRDAELSEILQRVEAVVGGTGQLVLLAGEPGVGKTRLAQEVTLRLRNRDFVLAAGRCYEPQQSIAFYPFLEALPQLFDIAPASIRADAAKRWPYLGQLLPDQIPVHAADSESSDDQQRLFRAVTAFVQAMAEQAPVGLLLDDLHWSDPSSLELLHHLARQTRADRVLLFGTYRDVEVDRQHPLEGTLRDLTREGLLTRIDVSRMEQEDTTHLIAEAMGEEHISPELAGLIQKRTDGNPFFVQQVMRVLVENGDIYREGGRWQRKAIEEIEVPESVRSVIGQRLSRLEEETQAVLREASVLGQTFNFDELQEATNRTEDAIERALEEAAKAGLVRPLQHDNYAFDHALTQQALYAELSPRRRRKLHLAAGEALEGLREVEREKRAGELAWHFLQADDPDRAILWAIRAGDQAEKVFAHSEAEMQYRTALELAEDIDQDAARSEVLEKLGDVLQTAGRMDEALELLERGAQIYRSRGERSREAAVVGHIGEVHGQRGTPEEGVERVKELLQEAEGEPNLFSDGDLAALYSSLAHLYFTGGRLGELVETSAHAVELARSAGDQNLLASALSRLAVGLIYENRYKDAIAVLEEQMAIAEALGDMRNASRGASNRAVVAYFDERDLAKHLEYRTRALEFAERGGEMGSVVFGEAMVCLALFELGRFDEAVSHARRGVDLGHGLGSTWDAGYALRMLGTVLMWQGIEEGRRIFTQGNELAHEIGDLQGMITGMHFLSQLDMVVGRPQEILELWQRMQEAWKTGSNPFYDSAAIAWAHLEMGNESQAIEELEKGGEVGPQRHGPFLVDNRLVWAMLDRRHERWDEAKSRLDEGLEIARQLRSPLREAHLLDEYGRLMAAKGEKDQAEQKFEESLTISRRLGAKPMIEYTERARGGLE